MPSLTLTLTDKYAEFNFPHSMITLPLCMYGYLCMYVCIYNINKYVCLYTCTHETNRRHILYLNNERGLPPVAAAPLPRRLIRPPTTMPPCRTPHTSTADQAHDNQSQRRISRHFCQTGLEWYGRTHLHVSGCALLGPCRRLSDLAPLGIYHQVSAPRV